MDKAAKRKMKLRYLGNEVFFLGPALLFFSLTLLLSFMLSFYYAFTDWNGVATQINWVGLENFKKLLTDKTLPKYFCVYSHFVYDLTRFSSGLIFFIEARFKTRRVIDKLRSDIQNIFAPTELIHLFFSKFFNLHGINLPLHLHYTPVIRLNPAYTYLSTKRDFIHPRVHI